MTAWFTIFLSLWSITAAASDKISEKPLDPSFIHTFVNDPEFNGINPKEAAEFWTRWKFVTTRFRTDTDHLRVVYANDTAMQALQSGAKVFPDGSMFLKVVYYAAPDSVFPSAKAPDQISRILVMKKDSKRYAKWNGWGYAPFKGATRVLPESSQNEVATACHACHQLVPEKDYVFSEAIFSALRPKPVNSPFEQKFVTKEAGKLTSFESGALKAFDLKGIKKLKIATMPVFWGSLTNSLGSMAQFAHQNGLPYLLFGESNPYFALVRAVPDKDAKCPKPAEYFMKVTNGLTRGRICGGKLIEYTDAAQSNSVQ